MSARPRNFVFALVLGILALFALNPRWGSRKDDLLYAGKPLSEHLLRADYDPISPDAGPALIASQQAITALGTNCVPLLRKWLTLETAEWRIRVGRQLSLNGIFSTYFPPIKLQTAALNAVTQVSDHGQLGVAGLSLVPALAPLCTNYSNWLVAGQATELLLSQITRMETSSGPIPDSVRAELAGVLKMLDLSSENRHSPLYQLAPLLGEFKDAKRLLSLKDLPRQEQAKVLRGLSRRNRLYPQVRSYLVDRLRSSDPALAENAVLCFKNYGEKATNALPDLEHALSHSDERVRSAATNAVARIKALSKMDRSVVFGVAE